jgi:hypothetical protein
MGTKRFLKSRDERKRVPRDVGSRISAMKDTLVPRPALRDRFRREADIAPSAYTEKPLKMSSQDHGFD